MLIEITYLMYQFSVILCLGLLRRLYKQVYRGFQNKISEFEIHVLWSSVISRERDSTVYYPYLILTKS